MNSLMKVEMPFKPFFVVSVKVFQSMLFTIELANSAAFLPISARLIVFNIPLMILTRPLNIEVIVFAMPFQFTPVIKLLSVLPTDLPTEAKLMPSSRLFQDSKNLFTVVTPTEAMPEIAELI